MQQYMLFYDDSPPECLQIMGPLGRHQYTPLDDHRTRQGNGVPGYLINAVTGGKG